jgi:hypothetical protein
MYVELYTYVYAGAEIKLETASNDDVMLKTFPISLNGTISDTIARLMGDDRLLNNVITAIAYNCHDSYANAISDELMNVHDKAIQAIAIFDKFMHFLNSNMPIVLPIIVITILDESKILF